VGSLALHPPEDVNSFNWILEAVNIPENIEQEMAKAGGKVSAVSDGSFKEAYGTAAWMVYITENCVIQGSCIAPGTAEDQSAYRSELTGLYGIACTIWALQHRWKLTGLVTAGCDGLSALRQAQKSADFIDPNLPQFDLIMAIRQIISQSCWRWEWIHVKGHQDETKEFADLDNWSQWNVQMDAAAKDKWYASKKQYIDPIIQGEPWRTEVQGKKITSNFREKLRDACTMPKALEYWERKKRFGSCSVDDIDWEALGSAMAGIPATRQRWRSKTMTGFCATGRMMYRRKEHATDECPRCGAPETVEHIWKCTTDTQKLWTKALTGLREWLTAQKTHPEMVRAIVNGIDSWRTGKTTPSTHVQWLQDIIMKQNECGWRNFFEGFFILDWKLAMHLHFKRARSKKSSKRWVAALIRKLWQVAWDLWEHRNGYLHDREDNLLSNQTNDGIKHQFELGYQNLDRATQALFQPGLQIVLGKPLEVRQQWVRRVQLARDAEHTQTSSAYVSERRMMAQWLRSLGSVEN
jgi:hypothetical protein